MKNGKIILAYSGGLDTSIILKWLIDRGNEVIAYVANVGQEDDFEACREKALNIGASDVVIDDVREPLVREFIFPAIQANAIYESRYLLGTALARPLIAKRMIETAKKFNAGVVSHGATGKGNDQVRFELSFYALNPEIKIYAPWKDNIFLQEFKGRSDLIRYAENSGIPVKATIDKPYSEDDNLMHISHEAGILEDPALKPDISVYSKITHPFKAPDKPDPIEISFKDGIPIELYHPESGRTETEPLKLFLMLNELGCKNGIGILDMVENRYVGIKSRGIYETPGGEILYHAHRDIEGIAMDREVMRLRNMLTPKFAELVYYGFWFSPEMDFLMAAIRKSQELIDGKVYLTLYKGNVLIDGRESPSSLYDQDLSSMDIEGGFDQTDSKGFIKINAVRLMAHHAIVSKHKKNHIYSL
ncbi:MAG: argininosuccinate synthase [Chlorobi bacterium]|nr:argininosuccinate synthase [Chlorobiota bacterium]